MTFSPPIKINLPAFREPSFQKHLNYDYKEMFMERNEIGDCYKSSVQYDMPFDRE